MPGLLSILALEGAARHSRPRTSAHRDALLAEAGCAIRGVLQARGGLHPTTRRERDGLSTRAGEPHPQTLRYLVQSDIQTVQSPLRAGV
jgi:hypothetical protein